MEMTMRWFGKDYDTVTLEQIKQTRYATGIITTLYNKMPGEVWNLDEILAMKKEVEDAGLHLAGIESVNVSDAIKTGGAGRDHDIQAYIETLENLGKADIHMVCYNFMPVFDWTRTELDRVREDGSTVMAYNQDAIDKMDPEKMFDAIKDDMNGTVMPGWEPERMAKIKDLFALYKGIDEDQLFENLKYFLEALMPVCKETGIVMAIHQDDPPWDIFGIPRLLCDKASIGRFLHMVDDPYNCLCLCSGSLGANPENDVANIIHTYCNRIAFAHIRNLRHYPNGDFSEVSHRDCDGDTGILEIMRAYHDCGYTGYIRPDHGRHLWGEESLCRPGYGLYDRALGIMYLWGCWDMLERLEPDSGQLRSISSDAK